MQVKSSDSLDDMLKITCQSQLGACSEDEMEVALKEPPVEEKPEVVQSEEKPNPKKKKKRKKKKKKKASIENVSVPKNFHRQLPLTAFP